MRLPHIFADNISFFDQLGAVVISFMAGLSALFLRWLSKRWFDEPAKARRVAKKAPRKRVAPRTSE